MACFAAFPLRPSHRFPGPLLLPPPPPPPTYNSYVTREARLVWRGTRTLLISNTPQPPDTGPRSLEWLTRKQQSIADVMCAESSVANESYAFFRSSETLRSEPPFKIRTTVFFLFVCFKTSDLNVVSRLESAAATRPWQQNCDCSRSMVFERKLLRDTGTPRNTHTHMKLISSAATFGRTSALGTPLPLRCPQTSNCNHIFSPSSCLSFPAGLDLLLMLTLVLSSGFRLLLFPEELYQKVWRFFEARNNIYFFSFSLSLSDSLSFKRSSCNTHPRCCRSLRWCTSWPLWSARRQVVTWRRRRPRCGSGRGGSPPVPVAQVILDYCTILSK